MTTLQRTELTTSQKVEFAAAALAGQGEHGAISTLSRQFGVSRPTVYATASSAKLVLASHFEHALLSGASVTVRVDDAQLRRAVVGLRVMGVNSIRAIEGLLPVVYPGVRVSYGKLQSLLVEAEEQASQFNRQMDWSQTEAVALDEMFSQGEPVLAGVDLDSGALIALELCGQRDASSWGAVLEAEREKGLEPSVVVKDAACGIAAAVSAVFPEAEQRDDCFHALYELNTLRGKLERRAYGAITREHEALTGLRRIRARERDRRVRAKRALSKAKAQCTEAVSRFDKVDAAMDKLRVAIECVDIDTGQLHRPEQVQAMVEQVADTLGALDVREAPALSKYLRNRAPGLALAQASLLPKLQQLGQHYPQEAVNLSCVIWYLVGALRKRPGRTRYRALSEHLLGTYAQLHRWVGDESVDKLLEQVEALLTGRHRASSAIEGFNAALRPFLYVHKGVTQGFLELYRAYYNLRTRRWGRHKGTSAMQCLTGQPVDDWLSVLGYPPSGTLH